MLLDNFEILVSDSYFLDSEAAKEALIVESEAGLMLSVSFWIFQLLTYRIPHKTLRWVLSNYSQELGIMELVLLLIAI